MYKKILKSILALFCLFLISFINLDDLRANYTYEITKDGETTKYEIDYTTMTEKINDEDPRALEDIEVIYVEAKYIHEPSSGDPNAVFVHTEDYLKNGLNYSELNKNPNYKGIYYYSHYSASISGELAKIPLQPTGNGSNVRYQPVDKIFDIRFDTGYFGSEENAKKVCRKYCNVECRQNSTGKMLRKDYYCSTDELRPSFFPELDYNNLNPKPYGNLYGYTLTNLKGYIRVVNEEKYPPIYLDGKHKCVNFEVSSFEKYWICESNIDMEKSCSGTYRKNDSERYDAIANIEAYTCWGNRKPNVYIKDSSGTHEYNGELYIKASEMPWITDKSIVKAMQDKGVNSSGDGVIANLGGIMNIISGEIDCEGALGTTADLLKEIFGYVRIGAIALLIILSAIDYIRAITSSEEIAIKTSNKTFIKRLFVTIAIFIVPAIVQFILAVVQLEQGLCGLENM